MTLSPGQKIGRFEVISPLGRGGMGSVYKGRDTQLNLDVAIKAVDPIDPSIVANHPAVVASFKAEATLAIQLRHPHIVGFVGYEEITRKGVTNLYLITTLVKGKSLQELIDEVAKGHGRYYPPAQAAEIMKQVLGGLHYAHQNMVVHRDIKPSNIMVEENTGNAIIIDFGIARAQSTTNQNKTQFMAAGAHSHFYSSPEQVYGTGTTAQSDVYSCGVVLYEMLTGNVRSVFPPDARARALSDVSHLPFISSEWEAIILKAAAFKPVDRYKTAAELSMAISQAQGGNAGFTPPQGNPGGPATPPLTGAGGPTTRRTILDIRKP